MKPPIESEQTERIHTSCDQCGAPLDPKSGPGCDCDDQPQEQPQTGSWALVLSGPLSERANTLVLREEQGDSEPVAAEKPDQQGWKDYDILSKIGEGGMGVVYLAQDENLGRKVAIKVLQVADMRQEDQQRFVAEARITSQLNHPNIVPVHEFGTTPEGELYYVMRRVRGREFGQFLEEDKPSLVRRIQILIDVCNAAEYAHSRGVIHRDIKPENILIGDFGEVLVVDWGLALVMAQAREHPAIDPVASRPRVSSDRPGEARLTQWGEVIGTICYMSPEQARGDHHLVGPETDVYAVGSLLYEMLTGRPPFAFKKEATVREMLLSVVEDTPAPPSQLDPAVPPDLEAIVVKAMSPRMTDRYQRIGQLREDLEAFLEHRPVSAHEAGLLFRLGKLFDRHRGIFVTAIVSLLLLFGAVVVFAALQYQEKEKTQHFLNLARSEKARVEESLRKKDEAVRQQQKAEAARKGERKKRLARERAESHLATGKFLIEHDPTSQKALDEMGEAVRIAPDYYRAYFVLAKAQVVRGQLAKAREQIDRCLELKPGFIPAMWVRVEILEAMMETVEDKLRRNTLLKMLRADYQEISRAAPGTAPGHCALGRLALMNNRQGVALKQFTLALKMDPSMPQAHAGLALLYGGAEQRQKSARHSEEALRRVPDQFTKRLLNRLLRNFSTKMKPLSECHRGLRLYEEARHDKALAKFELAADGFRKEGNEGEELRCRYYMALCYWELDRQQECLRLLRRTLARLIELKNELAVIVRGRLGLLLVQSGRWGEAVEVLPAVVGDYLDRREFLVAARQSSHLVYALLMLGEVEDARKKMDAAVELSAKYGRRDDLIVWTDAVLLRYEGRPEKALLLYVLLAHRHRRNLGRKLSYQLGSVSCLIENDKLDLAERRARSIEEAARKQDLLPQLLNAQRKQMAILRRRGLLKQALSLAIKTSSMGAQIDLQVGILAHIQGDNEVARRYLTRALKSDKGPHYARIYLVLQGLMSGGVGPVARDRYLTAAKEDESWPAPILNYLLGDLSTEELRKKSEKYPVYQMEVAYYLAEQHLANKMPKKAQRLFETCKTARLVDHFEYANSQDRLHQLNRR